MRKIKGLIDKTEGAYRFVASTDGLDRDGERILPTAFVNLHEYLRDNPVVLYGHDHRRPPVGKAINGQVTATQLIVDVEFAETEFGKEIRYLVDNGFLNAVSVGFIPKEWDSGDTRVYTKVELLEISVVPIPANAAALAMRAAAEEKIELKHFAAECLAEGAPGGESPATIGRGGKIKIFARCVRGGKS